MLPNRVIVGWAIWIAALGCGAAVPPLPGQGGPAWIELDSHHFTVWTDGAPERARTLIREMERFRQIVLGTVFASTPSAERSLVILLRDDDELAALSPTGEPRAYHVTTSPLLWRGLIVLPAFSNYDVANTTAAHELTHLISRLAVRRQPRWLSEGMATYFETLKLDESPRADLGVAPQYRGEPIRRGRMIPVSHLFRWSELSVNEGPQYTTAWALFTFLINEHRAELVRYLQLLDAPAPDGESPDERAIRIWNRAFPSLPLSTIDMELRQWLRFGRHIVTHVDVRLRPWPIAERRLGDADVYALRGLLYAQLRGRAPQAREAVAAALARDPTQLVAWIVRLLVDKATIPIDVGRALAAAHPDDWRAWLLAAHSIDAARGDAAETEDAIRNACRLGSPELIRESSRWRCEPSASEQPH